MILMNNLYKEFVNDFSLKLKREVYKKQYDKVIFFCVGTDRVIGDAFRTTCGI